MLGTNVLSDLEATVLPVSLQPITPWGKITILNQLETPKTTISELKKIQLPLFALRHSSSKEDVTKLQSELQTIQPHCQIVDESCTTEIQDERIKESVHQVLWDPKSFLAPLNTRPTILKGLFHWKTLLVPFFSVLMPILAVVVPFFILRFLHGSESVTIDAYVKHVRQALLKQITIPAFLKAKHSNDVLGMFTETTVLVFTIVTFFMGLWNQIQSALHLRSIAKGIDDRGTAMFEVVQSARRMLEILESNTNKKALKECIEEGNRALQPLEKYPSGLAGFGTAWNTPILFAPLISWIGKVDAYCTIVTQNSICFPRFSQSSVSFRIKDMKHPNLIKTPIENTAEFTESKHHALLTGPNRGGKSTFCKALGINILYAQTWGFAWASSMTFTPFTAMETALSLHDTLGKLSLFETEIEFTKHILQKSKQEPRMFVMMDEIFHSTNAKDGIAASRIFLKKLYASSSVYSLISTHYNELVGEFSKSVEAWQMMANEKDDGTLEYTYKKESGISEKSSVMEILKERGFLDA